MDRQREMRNFLYFTVLCAALCASASFAQSQSFQIGPAANPAAKIKAAEKLTAEKRSKEKEKREQCKKQAVTEKIMPRDRKAFIFSCEKK
jgi:hypothetical protein